MLDGFEAERDREVGLPDAGWSEQDEVSPCSTKWQRLSFWICLRSTEGWQAQPRALTASVPL